MSASQNSLKARFCFIQPLLVLEAGQNFMWITKYCKGLIFKNHKILFFFSFFLMLPLVCLNLEDLHFHVFLALIVSSGTFLTCSSSFLCFSAKLMTSCLTLRNLLGSPANKCAVRRAHDSSLSYYTGQSLTRTLVFLPLMICLIIGIAAPAVLGTWRGLLAAPRDVRGDEGGGMGALESPAL